MQRAARLSQYAWKYRYPGETEPPIRSEAEQALQLAQEVQRAVGGLLPIPDTGA
jgi:hypothetical protein